MIRRIYAIAVIVTTAVIGIATPAAGSAVADSSLVMPTITGMNLQNATDIVTSLTTDKQLVLNSKNIRGPARYQLVKSNWVVCWQAPLAGQPIGDNTWIGVGVVRAGEKCW
jgi:hypothetical protein